MHNLELVQAPFLIQFIFLHRPLHHLCNVNIDITYKAFQMNTDIKTPSYRQGLNELLQQLDTALPQEALAVFNEDAQRLEKTHQSILKLKVGDTAPSFSLPNATGANTELATLLEQGRVVLTFYRGSWCPYCNLQLNQYQQVLPEIQAMGAQLVAVSPQTPDESMSLKEKNELQFAVLSDEGNTVARQFTTVFKNGEKPIQAMKDLGIDFDSYYADDAQELPVPAVFIIEKDATISFAKAVGGDYRHRVEAADILTALKKS